MVAIYTEVEDDEDELRAALEEELLLQEMEDGSEEEDPEPLDPASAAFVDDLVLKTIVFMEHLCDVELYPYQKTLAYRIIESLINGDGEEITGLQSRQSGKSEVLADVIATCMVLFPRLAATFDRFAKFRKGLWIGIFAPTEDQADTIFSRVVSRLTSERATGILLDEEIDDSVKGSGKLVTLVRSGSFCRMQTANPKAKIESKSYHWVIIDEAQEADDYTVRKSIHPMLAHYNGTIVKIGTPSRQKGDFYRAIQQNKRRQTRRAAKQNHFEFDWKVCAKYNPNYAKFVRGEMRRLGEDSDEFQLSYAIQWLLDRGMLVTEARLEELLDPSMQLIKAWNRSPVVVGIDPARTKDSTVVTVCWVDWDHPDEFGMYEHRVLNWLEINNEEWEEQYFQIVDFLAYYRIYAIGVDSQGMGGPVAERLRLLMPHVNVVALESTQPAQSARWKHLQALLQRQQIIVPGHAKARRTRSWKRFYQQMVDAEKNYRGPHMMVAAPDEAEAHDDFVDSLAIACYLTVDMELPEVQVHDSPFFART